MTGSFCRNKKHEERIFPKGSLERPSQLEVCCADLCIHLFVYSCTDILVVFHGYEVVCCIYSFMYASVCVFMYIFIRSFPPLLGDVLCRFIYSSVCVFMYIFIRCFPPLQGDVLCRFMYSSVCVFMCVFIHCFPHLQGGMQY